jgi:hypothetical protein
MEKLEISGTLMLGILFELFFIQPVWVADVTASKLAIKRIAKNFFIRVVFANVVIC